MSGFTKGPWMITDMGTLIREGGNENHPIEVAGLNIAHFSRYECKTHQSANAHLIAAAPDMYEVLNCALEYVGIKGDADAAALEVMIQSVLTKAEGKS